MYAPLVCDKRVTTLERDGGERSVLQVSPVSPHGGRRGGKDARDSVSGLGSD